MFLSCLCFVLAILLFLVLCRFLFAIAVLALSPLFVFLVLSSCILVFACLWGGRGGSLILVSSEVSPEADPPCL